MNTEWVKQRIISTIAAELLNIKPEISVEKCNEVAENIHDSLKDYLNWDDDTK